MWKVISDWLLAFFHMARELEEHRAAIRHLQKQTRDLEEAIKLLAQEQRHSREMDRLERDKLLITIDSLRSEKRLLPNRRRKRR